VTFESPIGALVALAAIVPLGVLAVSAHRSEAVARLLGLRPGSRRPAVIASALAAAVFALLALAAAQPALRTTERVDVRTRSQVFFIVDVSRSMAASEKPRGRTRLDRAREVVTRLHAATPDVPSGLAGLTDRVLPYLFPTASSAAFDETLTRSVRIEAPPPQRVSVNATSFGGLSSLARDGFFDREADHRTCVLVSDGETSSYSTGDVARALAGERGCRLVAVRVGSAADSVYGAGGRPEAGYTPDPAAAAKLAQLAESTGGRAYGEGDVGAAAAAVRRAAEVGPVRHAAGRETKRPLGPYLALAALVLTAVLVGVRLRRPRLHVLRTYA
jgi:von Willebrand factor type A domain